MQIPSNDGQRAAQAAFEEHENPTKKGGAEKKRLSSYTQSGLSRLKARLLSLSLHQYYAQTKKKDDDFDGIIESDENWTILAG